MKHLNKGLSSRQMKRKFGTTTKEISGMIEQLKIEFEKEVLEDIEKTGKEEIVIKKSDLLKIADLSLTDLLKEVKKGNLQENIFLQKTSNEDLSIGKINYNLEEKVAHTPVYGVTQKGMSVTFDHNKKEN